MFSFYRRAPSRRRLRLGLLLLLLLVALMTLSAWGRLGFAALVGLFVARAPRSGRTLTARDATEPDAGGRQRVGSCGEFAEISTVVGCRTNMPTERNRRNLRLAAFALACVAVQQTDHLVRRKRSCRRRRVTKKTCRRREFANSGRRNSRNPWRQKKYVSRAKATALQKSCP